MIMILGNLNGLKILSIYRLFLALAFLSGSINLLILLLSLLVPLSMMYVSSEYHFHWHTSDLLGSSVELATLSSEVSFKIII